jgi:methionine aminopeptidase
MAEPPRKSGRIYSKRSWALHIEDNREVQLPAQSNICSTAQSEGSDINEKIQEGIQAAIPDISNSVISALKAHDLTFPTTQCVNDTAGHAEPDTDSTHLQPSRI